MGSADGQTWTEPGEQWKLIDKRKLQKLQVKRIKLEPPTRTKATSFSHPNLQKAEEDLAKALKTLSDGEVKGLDSTTQPSQQAHPPNVAPSKPPADIAKCSNQPHPKSHTINPPTPPKPPSAQLKELGSGKGSSSGRYIPLRPPTAVDGSTTQPSPQAPPPHVTPKQQSWPTVVPAEQYQGTHSTMQIPMSRHGRRQGETRQGNHDYYVHI